MPKSFFSEWDIQRLGRPHARRSRFTETCRDSAWSYVCGAVREPVMRAMDQVEELQEIKLPLKTNYGSGPSPEYHAYSARNVRRSQTAALWVYDHVGELSFDARSFVERIIGWVQPHFPSVEITHAQLNVVGFRDAAYDGVRLVGDYNTPEAWYWATLYCRLLSIDEADTPVELLRISDRHDKNTWYNISDQEDHISAWARILIGERAPVWYMIQNNAGPLYATGAIRGIQDARALWPEAVVFDYSTEDASDTE
jgi:hypothetical protein